MPASHIFKKLFSKGEVTESSLSYVPDSTGLGVLLNEKTYLRAKNGQGDELTLHQYNVFKMLLEQGEAQEIGSGRGIYFENEDAVRLDSNIRHILGLPEPWVGDFTVRTHGLTTGENFELYLDLVFPNGERIKKYKVEGPLLVLSKTEVYLPDSLQWQAVSAVTEHKGLLSYKKNEYKNLKTVHALITAKLSGLGIDLSAYKGLETLQPESVGLAVQENPETGDLVLTPSFGGEVLAANPNVAQPDPVESIQHVSVKCAGR